MKSLLKILVPVGLALLLVACGGTTEPEETEPEEVAFNIEMSEFSYSPEVIELKVGQNVTFNLVNSGQLEHELMIGREVVMENSLPSGYEVDFFENAGVEPLVAMEMHEDEHDEAEHEEAAGEHDEAEHEEAAGEHDEVEHEEGDSHDEAEHEEAGHGHHGFMVSLANEDKATLTFTVTEDMVGTWEMGCFLQDGAHYFADMKGSVVIEG